MEAGTSLRVNNNYFHVSWCSDINSGPLKKLFIPWQVKDGIKPSAKSFNIKISAYPKGFILESQSFTQISCKTIPDIFSILEFIITEEARNVL
jgi:hypothetical protein